MKNKLILFLLLCICLGCKKDPEFDTDDSLLSEKLNLPREVANYASPSLPAFFYNQFVTIQDNTPSSNPVTDWGATLGRVLFYDKQLSINHTIACASCHQQATGFTDTAQFSKGFNGAFTKRHSMSLANAKYYINGRFFWDERAKTLEEQVLQPIQDKVEMGMTLPELIQRLKNTTYYPILFRRAFDSEEINEGKIAKALAQFVRSMISFNSKYDLGRNAVSDRNADFPNYTAQENQGKKIFMTNLQVNCFGCHNTDAIITDNARNNGLALDNKDEGIFINTKNESDKGKFKASSLKNVALRGRFMHDGSLRSLDEVIEHYNTGISPNPNLDGHLKNGPNGSPAKMNLSPTDIEALKSFLHTLTDLTLVTDKKFSNPFK